MINALRLGSLALALGGAVGTIAVAGAAPPSGLQDISAGCSATIAGQSVAGRGLSSGDAIDVDQHTAVPVNFTSTRDIATYRVDIEFAGQKFKAEEGASDGNSWGDAVAVDDYASHGVGLYKVILTSFDNAGSSVCSGAVLVNVDGNPLETTAGIAAAGATGVGAVGLVATGGMAAAEGLRGGRRKRDIDDWIVDELELPGRGLGRKSKAEREEEFLRQWGPGPFLAMALGCWTMMLPALLISIGMLPAAAIGHGGGAASGATRLPRQPLRPKISLLSIGSGVLTGVGGLVLLQQYAVVFPTMNWALAAIIGGLLFGLVIPNIGRLYAVRQVNGAIARAEAALNRYDAAPSDGPTGGAAPSDTPASDAGETSDSTEESTD